MIWDLIRIVRGRGIFMGNITPNASQLEAINSIDGPLLISAGP